MKVMTANDRRPTSGPVGARFAERNKAGAGTPPGAVEALKRKMLSERLSTVTDPELRQQLQRAASDAAALAWTTGFPLLVLPELIEETGRVVQDRVERQRSIRQRSRSFVSFAA